MSYSWFQTSQTGGEWYSDTSPFSIPWLKKPKRDQFWARAKNRPKWNRPKIRRPIHRKKNSAVSHSNVRERRPGKVVSPAGEKHVGAPWRARAEGGSVCGQNGAALVSQLWKKVRFLRMKRKRCMAAVHPGRRGRGGCNGRIFVEGVKNNRKCSKSLTELATWWPDVTNLFFHDDCAKISWTVCP